MKDTQRIDANQKNHLLGFIDQMTPEERNSTLSDVSTSTSKQFINTRHYALKSSY